MKLLQKQYFKGGVFMITDNQLQENISKMIQDIETNLIQQSDRLGLKDEDKRSLYLLKQFLSDRITMLSSNTIGPGHLYLLDSHQAQTVYKMAKNINTNDQQLNEDLDSIIWLTERSTR